MRETQHGWRASARGESGGARLNFIIVVAVIALAGYAAYSYLPVAYNAYLYKDFMQETVDKAAYPPGQRLSWVEEQLREKAEEFGLPEDTDYSVQNHDRHIVARVRWKQAITLPGYVYDYDFDHTARSSSTVSPR